MLRLMTITVALLFILFQSIDVKVKIRETVFIKINLNIIAIVLYENIEKPKHLKDIWSNAIKIPIFLKAAKHLLAKSNVSIVAYDTSPSSDTTSFFNQIGSTIRDRLIISYLAVNSKRFRIQSVSTSRIIPNESRIRYDAHISFSFIHFINSALILLYYIARNKVKEVIKNV